MIDDLDRSLAKLLDLEFGTPLPFDLSFAVPGKDFAPQSKQKCTLGLYLHDIRENRELRELSRPVERLAGGLYTRASAPCRVKLSYCITAWSPGEMTPGIDPHLDEHNLLAAVLRVLLRHAELPAAALVGTLQQQRLPLPTQVAQPEPGRNPGDFWAAIGGQLRPSLDYSVTLALDHQAPEAGPLATSVQAHVGLREGGSTQLVAPADTLRAAGGTVWAAAAPGTPVAGAWVRVDETDEFTVADAEGRFILQRIRPGLNTLRVRAPGFAEAVKALQLPLAAGSHDVHLLPL